LCSTWNLEENDMKMLVGIFSNALYTYAPRCRTFPQKDGRGWVYKSNRSHLRVLLVKHTHIMYIYFFNFKSHFNWNMLIGCFLIDIARLIEKWVKIITEIGVFIKGEKLQMVWEEPPFSIPDFILYVVRIIVLKLHGNRSTGTKVIARKLMWRPTDFVWPKTLFYTKFISCPTDLFFFFFC
jgi:hypothetical protein